MRWVGHFLLAGGLSVFIFISGLKAAETLTLSGFLSEVEEKNGDVRSAFLASAGSGERSDEGSLLLSPTFFFNTELTSDAKLTAPRFLGYDALISKNFSLGVSKLTTFGLQGRLRYDVFAQNIINPVSLVQGQPLSGETFPASVVYASPVLELTQSLWSNGFGRSTRAYQEELEAQAKSKSFQSRYQARSLLVQAEQTYWRLALARQAVSIQIEALDRAKKMYEWNSRREKLHLAELADVLQTEALVKSRELELLSAQIEERISSRAFNSARSGESDHVEENLVPLDPQMIDQLKVPERAMLRDDVKSAQQNVRASTAAVEVAMERDLPTLEVYALLALNGQTNYTIYSELSDAIGPSFSLNRPTQRVGLRFSIPFDIGVAQKARTGYRKEQLAAELEYERKVFDQEREWVNLTNEFNDSKAHLGLSRRLEEVQESKLSVERDRLKKGRSTTYQVLLFEQDYLGAQLVRLRDQASVLNIVARMKLFGEKLGEKQ